MLKNIFYRLNRWIDKREKFKFIFIFLYVLTFNFLISKISLGQTKSLIFGVIMISILSIIAVLRIFIIYGRLKFDRSRYKVPKIGEIVLVRKDFYYDGSFRKFINTSDQSQKPAWYKFKKGTELVIIDIKETYGDWEIIYAPSIQEMQLLPKYKFILS